MSFDLRSRDLPGADAPAPGSVDSLVNGFLHRSTRRTRSARQRDLNTWFTFCEDFGVDVLMARRYLVVGYARYLHEVLDESPEVAWSRLGTLSDFYDYALSVGAVSGNPVPW
jgi:hypothetical protein